MFGIILRRKCSEYFQPFIWNREFCSVQRNNFAVAAFYKFRKTENPDQLAQKIREKMGTMEVKGRIYLNQIGINGQMCLPSEHLDEALDYLHHAYPDMDMKIHRSDFQVFNRLRVRHGKLLEGLDESFDSSSVGQHVSAAEWNQMLEENNEDTVILDVRNDYEWEVGHFKDSRQPTFRTFAEFIKYSEKFSKEVEKDQRILMYCTGGIRCELYSSILKRKGFQDVYQLNGGILKYGFQPDTSHWQGNLFVFDDRLVVPLDGDTNGDWSETISECRYCGVKCNTCYNCASFHCNKIFICCAKCVVKYKACCSVECSQSENTFFKQRNPSQINLDKYVGCGDHFREILKKDFSD